MLQRRRRYVLAALAACGAIAVVALALSGSGAGSAGEQSSGPISVSVSSAVLAKSGDYFSIAAAGGHLIVSGGPEGSLFDSGATTPSMVHGRPAGTCDSAVLDPATLALGDLQRGNCGNPALYHEHAIAVSYVNSRGTIAIASRRSTRRRPTGTRSVRS